MKNLLKPQNLPYFTLLSGVIVAFLRIWLYATGMEQQGLLARNHPADILSWVLTVLTLVVITIGCIKLVKAPRYAYNFPVSYPGFLGATAAGIGVAVTCVLALMEKPDTLGTIAAFLGFLAATSLIFLGIFRKDGKRPVILFHGIICLYLMLYLVSGYRNWSSSPQIQDYGFQLLAIVCLMVSTYQRASFDAQIGSRRSYAAFRLAAVFFCIACLPHSDRPVFYLTMALWAVTDLCSLTPIHPSKENDHEHP